MKLRTEMKDGQLVADGEYIDHQNIEWYQAEHVSHDAAAAHALLQAMKEHDALFGGETNETTTMKERAAELMAEWGFG